MRVCRVLHDTRDIRAKSRASHTLGARGLADRFANESTYQQAFTGCVSKNRILTVKEQLETGLKFRNN